MRLTRLDFALTGVLEAIHGLNEQPRRILLAHKRALATLQRRVAPEAKRDIGAEYNLKPGRIGQGLKARMTPDGIVLTGASRGINAVEFGATWRPTRGFREGAVYTIKRGQPRSPHAGAFIAIGKSANRLVFERATLGGRRAPRLPIQSVYGPSIGQMLKHGGRPARLAAYAIRILEAEQRRLLKL